MPEPIQQLFDHAMAEIKSTPQPTSSQLRDAAEKLFASVRAWKQSLPARPPREAYVRTSRPTNHGSFFVEPGVELREGDVFEAMSDELRQLCFERDVTPAKPEAIASAVEVAIKERWPDRAYFVEVHGPTGWIQIFQPYGLPRNQ